MYINKLKKVATTLCWLIFILISNMSCNSIIEPELPLDNLSNSLGNFELKNTRSTARKILLEWTISTNATKYDILVNDTISISNIKTNSYLLDRLEPNTFYKVSIRAYDKNNFIKTISSTLKTTFESLNEISMLPFGRYEYQRINITHCKVTSDNNYIILGDAWIHDKTYKIVLKTDKNFNIIWKFNFEGGVFDYGNRFLGQNIKECNDGGFLIITQRLNFKISKDGNIVYQNKYELVNYEPRIQNGIETIDGNFLFVGSHCWMFNSSSDTLWVKKINLDNITDVIQNDAESYFVYGYKKISSELSDERYNIKLVEVDNLGNQLNEILYPVSDACTSRLLLKSNDNSYYLLSHSTFTYYAVMSELCVTKTNNQGKELWTMHTYPELKMAVTVNSARVLQDNSLLCLCYYSGSQYYFVYEISPDGKITKTFRAGDMYVPIFVDKDENGRYTILTQGGYIYNLSIER